MAQAKTETNQTPKETPKATPKQTKSDAPVLKVLKLKPEATVPEKKTNGSCGLDLHVLDNIPVFPTHLRKEAYVLHTGLAFEIPEGYHVEIYLRSSTGKNRKLRLANGTGIIDSDYRGEIMLLVENVGQDVDHVFPGDRIAQAILVKDPEFTIEVVESLSDTKRGSKGFGSTGKN